MAKVTDEYVVTKFHRIFADLPAAEQRGIIRGLQTVHDTMQHVRTEVPVQPDLPLMEDADDSTDD